MQHCNPFHIKGNPQQEYYQQPASVLWHVFRVSISGQELHFNIFTAKTCRRIVQKKLGEQIPLPSRRLKAALLSL